MSLQTDRLYGVLTAPLAGRDGPIVVISNSVAPGNDRPPQPDLTAVSDLAKAMDGLFEIPGTRIRFGFDSVIGLFPGVGDVASALLAVFILNEARRLQVARLTIARMTANVVIDALGGTIPILGDAFDIYWKSNQRNVDLLKRHIESGPVAAKRSPGGDHHCHPDAQSDRGKASQ